MYAADQPVKILTYDYYRLETFQSEREQNVTHPVYMFAFCVLRNQNDTVRLLEKTEDKN